jgi:hypothetical protein
MAGLFGGQQETVIELSPESKLFRTLGLRTPLDRGAAAGAITLATMMFFKPGFAFTEGGASRPFGTGDGETLFPPLVVTAIVGIGAAMFA